MIPNDIALLIYYYLYVKVLKQVTTAKTTVLD